MFSTRIILVVFLTAFVERLNAKSAISAIIATALELSFFENASLRDFEILAMI